MDSMQRTLLTALILLSTTACIPPGTTPKTDDASLHISVAFMLMNQSMWKTANLRDYEFTYSVTPTDCAKINPLPAVVITVKNGAVSSVYNPEIGAYETDFAQWPTIDLLFDELSASAEQTPWVFSKAAVDVNSSPIFDAKYGFPVDVRVDLTSGSCDGVDYRITNFK
jgi:Family of unknown function (DUF6174)